MRSATVLLMILLLPSAASAQPGAVLYGGYSFGHPDFENAHVSTGDSLNGWVAGVDLPLADHVGIMARADWLFGDAFRTGIVTRPLGDEVRSHLYTLTAGPRVSTGGGEARLFADALVGVAHGTARASGVDFLSSIEGTKVVGGVGGGAQVRIAGPFGVLGDVQLRRTNLFDQTLTLIQADITLVVAFGR